MEKYHLTAEEIENLKGRKHDWWSESCVIAVKRASKHKISL